MSKEEMIDPKNWVVPDNGFKLTSVFDEYPSSFNFNGTSLQMSTKGFWVNGVKVEQGENEAKEVYEAFKKLIGYSK